MNLRVIALQLAIAALSMRWQCKRSATVEGPDDLVKEKF